MAGKLTKEHMNLLEGMIGSGPKSFKLLYSITRDGCSATEFHRKCDNQGPTVTVLYNPQGSVYGGFAGVGWASSGCYTKNDTAFIFQLMFSGERVLNIFRPKDTSKALFFGANYSTNFGNQDLLAFEDTVQMGKDGLFSLNGRIALGNFYHSNNVSNDAINNRSMVVTEMEVYAISDGARKSTTKQSAWRKTLSLSEDYTSKLKEELASITPPRESGLTNFRLLLVGPIGAGKSSFINTTMSAFTDRVMHKAAVGTTAHGLTRKYTPYSVRQTDGSSINVRLCDTPGLGNHSGMDAVNFNFLVDGHVPSLFEFSCSRHISSNTPGFIQRPSLAQEAHCVAIVLDASTLDDMSAGTKTSLNDFKNLAQEKGIPLAIVLTKIDKLNEEIPDCLADVFKRPEIKNAVDKVSESLGIPPNQVFPVKNYHCEVETEVTVHALALMALRKLILMASDALDERTSGGEDSHAESAEVTESDTA